MTTLDFSEVSEVFYNQVGADEAYFASRLLWSKHRDTRHGYTIEVSQYFDYPILKVRLTRTSNTGHLEVGVIQDTINKKVRVPTPLGTHDLFFLMGPTATWAVATVFLGGTSPDASITVPISNLLPPAEQYFDLSLDDAAGDQWFGEFLKANSSALGDLRMYRKKLLRVSSVLPSRFSSITTTNGYYKSLIDGSGADWYNYNRIMVDGVCSSDQLVLPVQPVVFVPPEQFLFDRYQCYRVRLGKDSDVYTFRKVYVDPTP
jgi:hypothetical protein